MSNPETPNDFLWTPIGFVSEMLHEPLNWWQDEALTWFEDSAGPIRAALCTPNGAGKSSKVVAGIALWWLATHEKGRVVITTKDGKQLVNQVWESIERHRDKFQHWSFLKSERKVENGTGGWMVGFTTDEPGRAEGWHKLNDDDGPLLIIVDEAKSVQENIFQAIDRCTYNALLYTSSPGLKSGSFYKAITDPRLGFKTLKVGLADCPHIPKSRIETVIAKYGPDHPFTMSTLHGEFMDEDEETRFVVPPSAVRMILESPPNYVHGGKVAFCDFAAGGAENVLAVKEGNRVDIRAAWRDPNTMSACGRFIIEFKKAGLRPSEIYGDNTGIGKIVIDRMEEMGWPINRVDNGEKPREEGYDHRGAEIWFKGSDAIQSLSCIIPDDEIMIAQMTTRKVVPRSDGTLAMEKKEDLAKRGLPSPDRADAVLGCLSIESTLASLFFESTGLRRLESMAAVSRPEHGNIEIVGDGLEYHSSSATPWLDVWERPVMGLSYLCALNPPRRDEANKDHVFHVYRMPYKSEDAGARNFRLACRISVPCRWDAMPLAEKVSRVVKWYGFPITIPIVNDRGDIIDALRECGVTMSTRRNEERLKRGKPTQVIQYGWESNDYTRSQWIGELAEAIQSEEIDIEDTNAVMELFHLSAENSANMREAEAIGVALKNATLASRMTPPPVNVFNPYDVPDGPRAGFLTTVKKNASQHAIS